MRVLQFSILILSSCVYHPIELAPWEAPDEDMTPEDEYTYGYGGYEGDYDEPTDTDTTDTDPGDTDNPPSDVDPSDVDPEPTCVDMSDVTTCLLAQCLWNLVTMACEEQP